MNESISKQTMTKSEYEAFVEEHNYTPTQDPVYNHKEGNPKKRHAAYQTGASALRYDASPTPKLGDNSPSYYESSQEVDE